MTGGGYIKHSLLDFPSSIKVIEIFSRSALVGRSILRRVCAVTATATKLIYQFAGH